jgi:SAM-dependent methyltransferase
LRQQSSCATVAKHEFGSDGGSDAATSGVVGLTLSPAKNILKMGNLELLLSAPCTHSQPRKWCAMLLLSVMFLGVALSYTLQQRGVPGTPVSAALQTTLHYETNHIAPGAHDDELNNRFLAELTKLSPDKCCRILDIGFGSGRCIDAFAAAGHRVLGLDSCQAYVRACRERADTQKVQLVCANLHDPFPESVSSLRFEGVFASRSLFHVYRLLLPSVLHDLHGQLLPGGIFFSLNPLPPCFTDEEDWGIDNDRRYAHFMTPSTWACLCEAAGFIAVDSYPWPPVVVDEHLAADRMWLSIWFRAHD